MSLELTPAAASAAGLAAAAVALSLAGTAVRPRRGASTSVHTGPADPEAARGSRGDTAAEQDLVVRHRLLISIAAGAAPVLLVGGPVGVAAGLVVVLLVNRALRRREPAGERRHREQIIRSLPQVVDLLAVVLSSGAAPSTALAVVAEAVGGPAAAELELARRGLHLGRDPVRVWRELGRRPGLSALGRSMVRAVETGASVSDALHRLADDLRASSRQEAESRARSVAVRAAAPLGLCLLPAFVLVGVVPLVASTLETLLGP